MIFTNIPLRSGRFAVRQGSLVNNVIIYTLAFILSIIAGYRLLGEGVDFLSYKSFYEGIHAFGESEYVRFELGFVWVASFFKLILNTKIEVLFTVLVSFSLLAKFAVFSAHRRPLLTILFYLCCFYPLHEYTQIRSAVSFAFALLAAAAFFRRQFVTFAALMILATLFHGSAIVLGVAIPVAWMLASLRLSIAIAITAGLVVLSGLLIQPLLVFAESLNPLTLSYAANLDGNAVNLFSPVNILTVLLLGAMLLARSLTDRHKRTLFILVVFGLVVAVSFYSIPIFSHRLREMFMLFLVPLAFDARRTPLGLAQMFLAAVLGGYSLYPQVSRGIIWI